MSLEINDIKGEQKGYGINSDFDKCIEKAETEEEVEACEIMREGCNDCVINDGKIVCTDPKDSITCFWSSNITQNMGIYDIDESANMVESKMRQKLREHGMLGWKEYADMIEGIYRDPSIEELAITHRGARIEITEKELRNALYKHIAEKLKEGYSGYGVFEEMKETYEKLGDWENLSKEEKILLFDEAIHRQHVTGNIMNVDVEGLREEFEEEIKNV